MQSQVNPPPPSRNPMKLQASFLECGVNTLRYSFYQIARQVSLFTKCVALIALTVYLISWSAFSGIIDSVFYEYLVLVILEIAVYVFKMEYSPGRIEEEFQQRKLPNQFDQTIDNNGSHANLKDESLAQAALQESIPINIKVTDDLRPIPIKDLENPSALPKKETENPYALMSMEELPPAVEPESLQLSIQLPPPEPLPMPAQNPIADPEKEDEGQWEDEEEEWVDESEPEPSESSSEEEKKEEEKKPDEPTAMEESSNSEDDDDDKYDDEMEEMGDKKDEPEPFMFKVGKQQVSLPPSFDPTFPWEWVLGSRDELAEAGKKLLILKSPETTTATAQEPAQATTTTAPGTAPVTRSPQDPAQAPATTPSPASPT